MRKKYFPTKYLFFLTLFMMYAIGLAQSASRATTGTGLYKDKIYWINWDLNSDLMQGDLITNGIVRTFTSPSGIVYKVTISNIVQTISPGTFSSANIDSYTGNNIPFGYGGFSSNSTKMIGLSNKITGGLGSGNKVNFRITVTATLPSGTVKNAAGLAIAGSESMSSSSEYYQLSVPVTSPVLRYLDKYIKNNTWSNMSTRLIVSNSGRTIRGTNPATGESRGDALLLAEDVPYIDVELAAPGGQHVAIGVFEELDFSDAPVSYGSAYHIINSAFTGGNFPDGNKDLSTTTNVLDTDRAVLVDPLLLIGTDIDAEGTGYNAVAGAIPNGDDLGGSDDEDASMNFTWSTCSATINVKNTTATAAKLYVWIDANRNGVFDSNELATKNVSVGTNGNVTVPLSSIKGLNNGTNFYTRIRLSTDLSLAPTGLAIDGEVEDHWVDITQSVISSVSSPVCQGSTVSLTGVNGAATYAWTGPNGFTSSLKSPTISNAQLVNAGTYSLKITTGSGCEFTESVVIAITALPSAPTASAQSFCSSEAKKVSDLLVSGTGIKWYSAPTAGTLYTGTETLLTGNYYASQTVSGCGESSRTLVAVTVNTTPTAPTASSQSFCSSEAKKVSDLSASGAGIKWYSALTAGTLYTGSETLLTGTYYASQTVNGCESSRTSVSVTVTPSPSAPTASAQIFCSSEAKKVSGLSASGAGIKWYSALTAGTLYTGTELLLTGTYYASQTVNGCESARTSVSVTVTPSPSAPTASAQIFCSSEAKKVSGLSASGAGIKWYSALTAGTLYTGTELLLTGTYYASQTVNGCESSRTSVSVTITPSPSAPTASAQSFCSSEAKKVSDLSASGTSVKWYSAPTAGTLYTGTETLLTGIYYASQTVNGCESSRTSVSVTITPSPSAPTASAQSFCSSEAKKVSDLSASGTSVKWYSAPTAGTLYTGTETLLTGIYYASQTVNGCESARTSVSVTVTPSPSAPTASAQSFCSSEAKKVSDLSASGTSVKWYSAPTAGTLYTGTETLLTGNYYASQTVNGCESARTSVSVTVTPSPSAPTASAQSFCSSEAKKVSDLSASGTSVKWYSAPTAGTLYTGTETLLTGIYYASQTVNGCESSRTSVSVTITPSPSAPTASAQIFCSSEAKKVSGTVCIRHIS
ncbi:GEVED domain-containing protein [Flavobacterium marginilacus]|uniref:Ig-like domain-containing protein n=1 Tax=Flavobacterium marginilacus TaxID=3003256 RepID=UPI00248EC3A8|nr:GEVED domain-containing protein [Flavobacterium marginilacus]